MARAPQREWPKMLTARILSILTFAIAAGLAVQAQWAEFDIFLISLVGHPVLILILEAIESTLFRLRMSWMSVAIALIAALNWAPILHFFSWI